MSLNADVVMLVLFALVALNVIGVVAYALAVKMKAKRKARNIQAIRAVILDYFRRSGVEVSVSCTELGQGRYTAMVESEPMKRFRLSHIIEMTLREHVRRSVSVDLDKIYWRFPVKQAQAQAMAAQATTEVQGAQAAAEDAKPDTESDDYINEGLEHYRHIPKPEVEELSWEQFEKAAAGINKDGTRQ
jgi:hypothetical protein